MFKFICLLHFYTLARPPSARNPSAEETRLAAPLVLMPALRFHCSTGVPLCYPPARMQWEDNLLFQLQRASQTEAQVILIKTPATGGKKKRRQNRERGLKPDSFQLRLGGCREGEQWKVGQHFPWQLLSTMNNGG